jgi:hypothetical protein
MHFEKPGKHNTEKTLEVIKKAVKERGIKHVVVATCEGYTAKLFQEANLGINLVCVTHVAGFETPGDSSIPFRYSPSMAFGINHTSAMTPFGLFNRLPSLHKLTLDTPRLYLNSFRDEVCI